MSNTTIEIPATTIEIPATNENGYPHAYGMLTGSTLLLEIQKNLPEDELRKAVDAFVLRARMIDAALSKWHDERVGMLTKKETA
jgi:hypothetical protein